MRVNENPRIAEQSDRGKNGKHAKVNYRNYYNRKYDFALLQKIGRESSQLVSVLALRIARSMAREKAGAGGRI